MANINDMFLSLIEGLSFQNGVYVDNQKDNETLYEVNRMGSSEALDPQNIKKIVKKTDDAKLFMVDMFDLHIGGQAHKSARARMVFDFVAKTRNAYTVLGGDIFDNANLEGQTNPTLSKVIPYYQEDYLESLPEVRECLRENKIIAAVYGNEQPRLLPRDQGRGEQDRGTENEVCRYGFAIKGGKRYEKTHLLRSAGSQKMRFVL